VIAIDILIEPDAVMVAQAKTVNVRLRQNYPAGFPLDDSHVPHLTLMQRYVRAADLEALGAALNHALAAGPAFPLQLTTISYEASEWDGLGTLVYAIEGSPELKQLTLMMEKVVRPFAVSGGNAGAFARASAEEISTNMIRYVETFVPVCSGENFFPHVTLGKAQHDFVSALATEPFKQFFFTGVNVAIYQLGDSGTAQKRLWTWR